MLILHTTSNLKPSLTITLVVDSLAIDITSPQDRRPNLPGLVCYITTLLLVINPSILCVVVLLYIADLLDDIRTGVISKYALYWRLGV